MKRKLVPNLMGKNCNGYPGRWYMRQMMRLEIQQNGAQGFFRMSFCGSTKEMPYIPFMMQKVIRHWKLLNLWKMPWHGPMNLLQMEETLKILFQTKRRQIPKKNKKKVKLHRIKVQLPIFRSVMTIWGKDLQKRNSEGILLPLCCLTGSNRKTDTLQQKNSRFSVNILDGVDWRMPLTKANQTGLKNISN